MRHVVGDRSARVRQEVDDVLSGRKMPESNPFLMKGIERMSIQTQLTLDLQQAIQQRCSCVPTLKLIVGELQRLPDKVLTDDQVIATLKKLAKAERENLDRAGKQSSPYLSILQGYMPQTVSEEDVKAWILANVPKETLASSQKFTCSKMVLAHFAGRTDGGAVRKVLGNL